MARMPAKISFQVEAFSRISNQRLATSGGKGTGFER
jgi:hypothetical protein